MAANSERAGLRQTPGKVRSLGRLLATFLLPLAQLAVSSYDLPQMSASTGPRGRIRVGNVINETFAVYSQNFGALIMSALVVFLLIGVVTGLLQRSGGVVLNVIAGIIQLAAYALYTGFVVQLVRDVRDGRRDYAVGDLFSAATPAIIPLALFGLMFGIAVAIGFILIIIPGLILLTFWCVGAAAIVVENAGPIEAFGRSWNLVRGDAWSVFGTLLVVFIIIVVIQVVLAVIATPIGTAAIVVASIISSVITAPISAIAISVMFFDLGGGAGATTAPGAFGDPLSPSGPVS